MLTTGMAHTAWALASVALGRTLVRLILGILAVHATRKALGPSAPSKAADRLRAHRLAVLRALLNGLRRPGR
jgi:hypothetical protein